MTDSLEQLYEAHAKQAYNLALQYVQNSEDAQEITQDVFLAIHQQLNAFRGESAVGTWIYRITVNKSLDFLKAKKRKKRFGFFSAFSATSEPHHFDHPGVLMENREQTERIFSFINELSENQKTALILHKIEQKSTAEVAEIMELTPKAVESLLQRARINLSKKLENREG